jgi:beta-glucosidase
MEEDVALLRGLNVGAYRFSIAWPRIQPAGQGRPLQAGLDHYARFADLLLEAGIEPWVTLYHWDLPLALEEAGGWPERDTALRFAEYADIVYRALGGRVKRWVTANEPWCAAFLGYSTGEQAPGRRDKAAAYRAAHHLLLGHGLAVEACRAACPGAQVGIVLNPAMPRAATARPEDAAAAERASVERTGLWLDPLFGRGYPEAHLASRGVSMPVEAGDMSRIASPMDFVGVNYYNEDEVMAAPVGPECPDGAISVEGWQERTEMGWSIVPDGLERILVGIHGKWSPKALYVHENGAAFADATDSNGRIRDLDRIQYLRSHIAACRAAIGDGVPLKGYFVWTLMDNFEWSFGYSRKFGLVSVDRATGERRPKASYHYYRGVIAGYGL